MVGVDLRMFFVPLLQVGAFSHGKIDDSYTDDFVAGAHASYTSSNVSRNLCLFAMLIIRDSRFLHKALWSHK